METITHNPLEDDLARLEQTSPEELGSLAVTTAFEDLAETPTSGSTVEGPVMTETTWDHSSKSTDSRDSGSGFTGGSVL